MSNKMLIDASHPEETRVAVVRGNRIEEFDFESQEKKQLRGNIYLAKVTRVEPSLQAAFIDYGGNRHGFLAFSEIHPDYYQIPVADRQALIEAEAAEARAARDADNADDDDVVEANDDQPEEAPKKKPRRRRARKAKSSDAETGDAEASESDEQDTGDADASSADTETSDTDAVESVEADNAEVEAEADAEAPEEKPKPKRRSTRRKPAPRKVEAAKEDDAAQSESDNASEETSGDSDDGSDDGSPQTMAAMIEMDEISEPLPDDEDRGSEDEADGSDDEAASEEKPKRRRTSRPRRKTKAERDAEAAEETASEETQSDDRSDEAASDSALEAEKAPETTEANEAEATEDAEPAQAEATEKPKRQSRRRSGRKKEEAKQTPDDADTDDATDDDDADASGDNDVESVGQEDALEEVPTPRRQRRHYKIQEVIKRRQVLLVQVVKEERGTKGAALTTYLSLAGRYSVLMPNTARGGGISRKITNSSDRKRLKAIASELEVPTGMGVILRTAGAARTKDEINRDFEYLMRLWEKVRNLTLSSSAPCLVYEEGSLIKRSIRDLYDKDTGEVIVAGEDGYQEAKDFMTMLMPSHANKVKQYTGSQAIFAKYGVEGHLDKMVSPEVTLKSGGYLVINQTEALVAVDVNSGRSTREHSVEDTALQTNLEAAEEVARQLRLRDLAGLIVIDFIDMEERRNNRSVEKRLKDCLKNDRARIQVGRISHFGLMEMSRQRMRASVLESTMDTCPHCAGTGYVRSDSAIALHVFRAIEEHVAKHRRFDCIVKTSPSIAIHILNHKRAALMELESRYGLQVLIEADSDIAGQEFKIEKGGTASGDAAPAPIGYQNDAAPDEVDSASEDGEENGRKKRGRNRRRKNQDADGSTEQSAAEGSDESSEGETPENDDDQPRKKRRRGKRGGRKGKAATGENDDNSNSNDAETSEGVGNDSGGPKQADAAVAEQNTTESVTESDDSPAGEDAETAKPKTRSTRRRKAPIAPKPEQNDEAAEANSDESASQEEQPTAEAEAKKPPRRRTTRRAAPKADDAGDDTSVEPSEPASDETATEDTAGDKDSGEKKKSGWWGRGGGFF